MTYTYFRNAVLRHLARYKKEILAIQESGSYRYRGNDILEEHILPISEGERKESIVKTYNVLSCLKHKKFLLKGGDLHRFAHHLNSSQLMCYNFFRPYLEVEGSKTRPNRYLIELLRDCGLAINPCNDAECQFEYVQGGDYEGEGTNFDFYLRSGETEVFFEIKYTEEGFGKGENDDRHKEKFERIYDRLIKGCPAIKCPVNFNDEFRENYQLFRNSIRVKDKNKFVIFIYDQNNPYCRNQLNGFLDKFISTDYRVNVKGITWQEFVEKLEPSHHDEFCEKYMNY